MLVVKDSGLLRKAIDGYFLGLDGSFQKLREKIVRLQVDQHDQDKAEKLLDFLRDAFWIYSFFRNPPFCWDYTAGLAEIDLAINAAMADKIEDALLHLQQAEKWRMFIISDPMGLPKTAAY